MVGMHLMLYALCCMAERTGSMHADQMNKPIERLLGQEYHEGALHGRHLSIIGMHRLHSSCRLEQLQLHRLGFCYNGGRGV